MKLIALSQGAVASVDDEDYERLSAHSWCVSASKNGLKYAKCRLSRKIGAPGLYMHRLVSGAVVAQYVDHINGDTLDNRKENLRICQQSQNMCNRGKQANNKSGIKGVCWNKGAQKWVAQIAFRGKGLYLGLYESKELAAAAYAKAAYQHHGEFARLQ